MPRVTVYDNAEPAVAVTISSLAVSFAITIVNGKLGGKPLFDSTVIVVSDGLIENVSVVLIAVDE